jgi:hypothetical protein
VFGGMPLLGILPDMAAEANRSFICGSGAGTRLDPLETQLHIQRESFMTKFIAALGFSTALMLAPALAQTTAPAPDATAPAAAPDASAPAPMHHHHHHHHHHHGGFGIYIR